MLSEIEIAPDRDKQEERRDDHAHQNAAKKPRGGIMSQFMVGKLRLNAHLRLRGATEPEVPRPLLTYLTL